VICEREERRERHISMLHFAYGSNMDRAVMGRHAPCARPLGVASLKNHCFMITGDGYASVEPAPAATVHGVLWRITPRDRVTLDLWENVAGGQYRAKILPVNWVGRRCQALIYVARPRPPGRAKTGYMELVVAAARAWNLPLGYIASLQCFLPAQTIGSHGRKLKPFAI
jgi:AIG2-like family